MIAVDAGPPVGLPDLVLSELGRATEVDARRKSAAMSVLKKLVLEKIGIYGIPTVRIMIKGFLGVKITCTRHSYGLLDSCYVFGCQIIHLANEYFEMISWQKLSLYTLTLYV